MLCERVLRKRQLPAGPLHLRKEGFLCLRVLLCSQLRQIAIEIAARQIDLKSRHRKSVKELADACRATTVLNFDAKVTRGGLREVPPDVLRSSPYLDLDKSCLFNHNEVYGAIAACRLRPVVDDIHHLPTSCDVLHRMFLVQPRVDNDAKACNVAYPREADAHALQFGHCAFKRLQTCRGLKQRQLRSDAPDECIEHRSETCPIVREHRRVGQPGCLAPAQPRAKPVDGTPGVLAHGRSVPEHAPP